MYKTGKSFKSQNIKKLSSNELHINLKKINVVGFRQELCSVILTMISKKAILKQKKIIV